MAGSKNSQTTLRNTGLAAFRPDGSASSYFDVHALVKVGPLVLHPAVPLHLESVITHKPPGLGDAYMNLATQPAI